MRGLVAALWGRPSLRRWIGAGVILALAVGGWWAVLTVQWTLFFARTGLDTDGASPPRRAAKDIVTAVVKPYYDHQLLTHTSLPVYDVELTENRLQQWHGILERVTERGKSTPEDQVYIPATFRRGDEEYRVDLRGRGTLAGHYRKAKPSFRIKFPKDRFFEGNRVMNYIIPYEQARVVVDTTLNAVARQTGLLAYPRGFAVVRMNGRVLGVYQEMQHFRKELAVLQGRSEGYFVSALGEGKGGADPADNRGFGEAVEALKTCTRGCSEAEAHHLLDTYFDFDKTALYAALTTWFESEHAWGPDNLILFFDPGRGRFEPIPWDVGQHPIYRKPGADEAPEAMFESVVDIGGAFLALDDFRERRNEHLWDLVTRKEAYALAEGTRQYAEIRPDLDFDTEYTRGRTQRFFDGFQKIVQGNSRLLREVLEQTRLQVEVGSDGATLVNPGVAGLTIESLTLVGPDGTTWAEAAGTVPGRWRDRLGRLEVPWSDGSVEGGAAEEITVEVVAHNRLSGAPLDPATVSVTKTVTASDWASSEMGESAEESAEPSTAIPDGVRVERDAEGTRWVFAGTVRLRESWAMPEGVAAVFEPGLRLTLDGDVALVIRGDLTSLGTPDAPITVAATDPAKPFSTLAVLGRSSAPAEVWAEHTTVNGGREGDYRGVHFLGSFSVYDGNLTLRSSRILNAAGEDGLNVKFGSVLLEDVLFENTAGDALDLDFCRGVLRRNTVRHSKADGFDFSGSSIEMTDNLFTDLADKGVSIGEDSTVTARKNRVERAITGFAIKDLSLAALEDNVFVDLEVGVAIYQKKQVFGSGVALHAPGPLERVASELLEDPGAVVYRP